MSRGPSGTRRAASGNQWLAAGRCQDVDQCDWPVGHGPHSIHVWSIYLHLPSNQPYVGKYTKPMDDMCKVTVVFFWGLKKNHLFTCWRSNMLTIRRMDEVWSWGWWCHCRNSDAFTYLDLLRGAEWMIRGAVNVPLHHLLGLKQHPLEDDGTHLYTSISWRCYLVHIAFTIYSICYVGIEPSAISEAGPRSTTDHRQDSPSQHLALVASQFSQIASCGKKQRKPSGSGAVFLLSMAWNFGRTS